MPIKLCTGGGSVVVLPSVTNFSVTADPGNAEQMDLAWDDHPSELNYVIDRSTDGITYVFDGGVAAGATSYVATGLTASTLYYFRIRAMNGEGISNAVSDSDTTSAYTPLPGAVDPTTADSRWRSDGMNFTTGDCTDIGGNAIDMEVRDITDEIPTEIASWQNTEPAMDFDGLFNTLNNDNSGFGYTRNNPTGPFACIIAGEWTAAGFGDIFGAACTFGAGSRFFGIRTFADGDLQIRRNGASGTSTIAAGAGTMTVGDPFVLSVRCTGTTTDVWLNRVKVITAGSLAGGTQSCVMDNQAIGGLWYFTSPSDPINTWEGIIAETIFWDSPPSEADLITHSDFIHNYYAIPY